MATGAQSELISEIPSGLRIPRAYVHQRAPRKVLVRRTTRDHSQILRRGFQFSFLLWNVILGGLFVLWVRQCETGIASPHLNRPAGVEGWLPIAGLMNFKYWLATGQIPRIHPAAMFLLISFLAISFLFRKAFCSWLCPIGTISEYFWRSGRKLLGRNVILPRWLDIPLRGCKYLLLGFFLWAVSSMSVSAISEFMRSTYGVIADVRMLNFFRYIGETGAIVLCALAVVSLFVQNFWCRYLCPYGALLGLSSLFSPIGIRRSPGACIDCAKCTKACPAALPVDKLKSVKSVECTGCLECVAVCPAENALQVVAIPLMDRQQRRLPAWAMGMGIAAVLLGIVGYAKIAGRWETQLPRSVYIELIPRAQQAAHPVPADLDRER
jgi:polyferredoxin